MTEGQPTKPNNPLFEKVVQSKDTKRIVVAGPGTGKTLLFKELLLARSKNTLTLTFINSLVDELALELCGLTEPKTLHAFARSLLHKANGANSIPVSSHLTEIIGLDYEVVTGKTVDYRKIFHLVEDDEEAISFYKKRQKFYEHYCYADLIYDAVTHLSDAKNQKDIPIFDQIFVDEFQDFNELEVRFIELLAQKSPVLLVGDDNQALYDRKHASTKHIRERYSGVVPGYSPSLLINAGETLRLSLAPSTTWLAMQFLKAFFRTE
ncbi:MAG: AAA family ATPase [Rhizobiales bacterium]|nr:AAA family ATPase [Hyphomicrobiales bacterium]